MTVITAVPQVKVMVLFVVALRGKVKMGVGLPVVEVTTPEEVTPPPVLLAEVNVVKVVNPVPSEVSVEGCVPVAVAVFAFVPPEVGEPEEAAEGFSVVVVVFPVTVTVSEEEKVVVA